MQKPLALVGLPGSGKSFWAKKIAEHLDAPYYDLDTIITTETGLSISKIFTEFGEVTFRKIESDALKELLQNPLQEKFILSLGGGTPAFYNNMALINQYCTSIYLNVELDTIIKNITADQNQHRPMVKNTSKEELYLLLQKLLAEREDFYKMAEYMIFQNELTLANFEKIIQDSL